MRRSEQFYTLVRTLGFHQVLAAGLAGAASFGYHPWSATVALLVLLGHEIADRYFRHTFFDEHSSQIGKLQAECARLKEKQDKLDLKSAFQGGSRG